MWQGGRQCLFSCSTTSDRWRPWTGGPCSPRSTRTRMVLRATCSCSISASSATSTGVAAMWSPFGRPSTQRRWWQSVFSRSRTTLSFPIRVLALLVAPEWSPANRPQGPCMDRGRRGHAFARLERVRASAPGLADGARRCHCLATRTRCVGRAPRARKLSDCSRDARGSAWGRRNSSLLKYEMGIALVVGTAGKIGRGRKNGYRIWTTDQLTAT